MKVMKNGRERSRVEMKAEAPSQRPPPSVAEPFWVYVDEAGNTGQNLFDAAQPNFWVAALIAPLDFDVAAREAVEECNRITGASELHANQLGLPRLERIAPILLEIITRHRCRLLFVRVHKRHLASMKLADTVLDSGLNPAVSPLHYLARPLRFPLVLDFVLNVSPQSQEEFWAAYDRHDLNAFRQVVRRVRWNVQMRVKDPRARQLLDDALGWGVEHPDSLMIGRRGLMDSPNLVAFSLLVGCLHHMMGPEPRIVKFVCDEQDQFGGAMGEMFQMISRLALSPEPLSWALDIKEVHTFAAPVEIKRSSTSPALQIVDALLWLMRRQMEEQIEGFPKCAELIDAIIKTGAFSDFSPGQLAHDSIEAMRVLAEKPLTAQDVARAQAIVTEAEEIRKRRMSESG